MARVVVLGAGISGHTAALIARRRLSKKHSVTVISPKADYNWIPSNIWVGVGAMQKSEVLIPLKPIYDRMGIEFVQARATELHPEGDSALDSPFVVTERQEKIPYDYLINATGPKLNFGATPGLGPEGHSVSVCTADHADHAGKQFLDCIEKMKRGEQQTFLIGTGHGTCTCEGAAFEYVFNVEFELRKYGVRDKARIVFITNEAALGDFGVGGLHFKQGGFIVQSKTFAESLFAERGVESIVGAHVSKVEAGKAYYETLEGEESTVDFDFAMLLPPFTGTGLQAFSKAGEDITSQFFMPNGFMRVDADYSGKPYEEWKASDWPKTYQCPAAPNVYAVGIAFAPPHPISMPRKSAKGTPITPAPPRTGMPSAIIGRNTAITIADLIQGKKPKKRASSLTELGAACVASAGANFWSGSAASMTMYPIVQDYDRYPEYGRDLQYTFGEIGSAGHWIKRILHTMFIYKAKARPFWWIIPE